MNYKERIAALNTFKTAITEGDTTDSVSGVSTDVSGWEGNADSKFDDYVLTIKADCADISAKKASFLSEVDGRISQIQAMFDLDVALNSWRLGMVYDSKDSANNKALVYDSISQADLDSSVRDYLLGMVY
ncbi:hypothetical protein A6J84_009250 [Streptococcus sp. FDAARGOS_256]|jgi:hypothetical protein|uniref:Phage protein n=1 Tax=Streptococcus oralis subsp. oralis TaxID=1891914 RepID=A0A1X1HVU4_STROR|nr:MULTISPECIES: hypothetical protein [Streptococcus]MCY7087280.1 hypothetical protein [Streptococcus oralis]ORO65032.1 hypothetical protein B7714_09200 [Streptococcus oralis subsp. oralis]PNK72434.1 hypothetical protein A6J84_009250 [Streptococcus sp. FDAARGOS_256]RKV91041.1 MAG: hypothetical protein D8H99_32280 [Streptococcus sp.]